jgi:hypothetical protein
MEKGLIPINDDVAEVLDTVRLSKGERCAIIRRRFKKRLIDASRVIGIHQHRLSEMERGLLRKVDPRYVAWIEKLIND